MTSCQNRWFARAQSARVGVSLRGTLRLAFRPQVLPKRRPTAKEILPRLRRSDDVRITFGTLEEHQNGCNNGSSQAPKSDLGWNWWTQQFNWWYIGLQYAPHQAEQSDILAWIRFT